jgi:hypothetical protein
MNAVLHSHWREVSALESWYVMLCGNVGRYHLEAVCSTQRKKVVSNSAKQLYFLPSMKLQMYELRIYVLYFPLDVNTSTLLTSFCRHVFSSFELAFTQRMVVVTQRGWGEEG